MIKFKKELNPKFWENNKLKEEVKEKIIEVVDKYKSWLDEDAIDIDITDIIIVGSNASYDYNSKSDLDVHIVVNNENETDMKLYDCYRVEFRNTYDIKFDKVNVELYVQNNYDIDSNGIYSIYDGWIKEPEKIEDTFDVKEDVKKYKEEFEELSKEKDIDKTSEFINRIYELRKSGIEQHGFNSKENYTFKELRKSGLIEKAKKLKISLENKKLSIGDVNMSNQFNAYYSRAVSEMDEDMDIIYESLDPIAISLKKLGYKHVDANVWNKAFGEYTKVVEALGGGDYKYYVLDENGEIPSGWTYTKTNLDILEGEDKRKVINDYSDLEAYTKMLRQMGEIEYTEKVVDVDDKDENLLTIYDMENNQKYLLNLETGEKKFLESNVGDSNDSSEDLLEAEGIAKSGINAELNTTSDYDSWVLRLKELYKKTGDKKYLSAAEQIEDISREEKVHAGEFSQIYADLDNENAEAVKEGMEEVREDDSDINDESLENKYIIYSNDEKIDSAKDKEEAMSKASELKKNYKNISIKLIK